MTSSAASSVIIFLILVQFIGYSEATFGVLFLGICLADIEEPWTYRRLDLIKGPYVWGKIFPECRGTKQSPIVIETRYVVKDENLEPLGFENYNVPMSEAMIVNVGHTIEVNPRDSVPRTIKVNGEDYSLVTFFFHWGFRNSKGSEHGIDGQFYAMELHILCKTEGGLYAVVGIFLEEQDHENEELQKIVDKLPQVKYNGNEAKMNSDFDLMELLPQNPTYYRYNGSWTIPPCTEEVTWSVLKEPIKIGKFQVKKFHRVYSATEDKALENCHIFQNHRPLQPIGDRTIYQSP